MARLTDNLCYEFLFKKI